MGFSTGYVRTRLDYLLEVKCPDGDRTLVLSADGKLATQLATDKAWIEAYESAFQNFLATAPSELRSLCR